MAPAADPRKPGSKKPREASPTPPRPGSKDAAPNAAAEAGARPAKAAPSGDSVEFSKARAPVQLDPKGGHPVAPRAGAPAPLTSVDVGAKNATCIKG